MSCHFISYREDPRDVDEELALTDINYGGRYLQDVEIAVLFDKMVKKMLYVSAVFGSQFYSGGDTKNGVCPRHRSAGCYSTVSDTSDIPPEDTNSALVAEVLQPSQTQRNFWLEPQGYVLIAACLPTQAAWKTGLGHRPHDLLTYWLIDCLQSAARKGTLSKLTHDMLHQRDLA